MQYDQPTTAEDITTALQADPTISQATRDAIVAILGLETAIDTAICRKLKWQRRGRYHRP